MFLIFFLLKAFVCRFCRLSTTIRSGVRQGGRICPPPASGARSAEYPSGARVKRGYGARAPPPSQVQPPVAKAMHAAAAPALNSPEQVTGASCHQPRRLLVVFANKAVAHLAGRAGARSTAARLNAAPPTSIEHWRARAAPSAGR